MLLNKARGWCVKMENNKSSFIMVALTNIIILCLIQTIYWSLLNETIDMIIFQFFIFPLVILLINIFLWFSKFKLEFYQHALFAYTGFFVSIIVSSFLILIILDHQELPPGEIVLFADVIFIFITAIVQLIILLLINFLIYLFYKIFFSRKTNPKF